MPKHIDQRGVLMVAKRLDAAARDSSSPPDTYMHVRVNHPQPRPKPRKRSKEGQLGAHFVRSS
ncbi:MAG: hypothetical protein JSU73_05755 [candidate division WOR-3 bacterium]|nr:MAG: hypothetical protein JSU73_05755 [candidate division WOR-3 bacterium]